MSGDWCHMKILFVSDQYASGGATDALIEMMESLKNTWDIDSFVITGHKDEAGKRLEECNIPHLCLGYRQFAYNAKKGIRQFVFKPVYYIAFHICNRVAMKKAFKNINFKDFDLIHSNVDRNDIGGLLARKYKIPHVWHLRESTEGHFNLNFNRLFPYAYMNHVTSVFIATSMYVKNDWVSKGLNPDKLKVLCDGVDVKKITYKYEGEVEKKANDKIKIICVGEITQEKGQFEIVKMIEKLGRNYRVDFYGNYETRYGQEVREYVRSNGLTDRIFFAGYRKELCRILNQYDIGINPSINEGFGRTTVEYMAAGLCTICKRSGASIEIVNAQSGFTYDSRNELAQILQELYSDRELIKRKGENGHRVAMELYDINKNINEFYYLYRDLLDKKDGERG